MKRALLLTPLLAAMFVATACGTEGTGDSGRPDPAGEATRAATAPQEPTERTDPAGREGTTVRAEADREDEGSSGISVTTMQGETVEAGGTGHVTALFFMAGW